MNDGALYQRSNPMQRNDAKQMIDTFSHQFKWRPDGKDSLLDIGCGSGDVTIDFILPVLPPKFTRLVGVDISDGMLNYARQSYQHSKIVFEKLDVGLPLESKAWTVPFDHVTSFYCLHWVRDQQQAVSNIYNLLAPEGDCLLVYLASHPYFDVTKRLSENPRWAPYLTDIFYPPYQHSGNAIDELTELLKNTGFGEFSVQVVDKTFAFEGISLLKSKFNLLKYVYLRIFIQSFSDSVQAVLPCIHQMQPNEQADFLEDYIEIVRTMGFIVENEGGKEANIIAPYKLIVVYARK